MGGRTGFRNLGNTCYINSLFQVLIHVPTLKRYYTRDLVGLLGGAKSLEPNEHPKIKADPDDPVLLSRQLVVLCRLAWSSGRATHTPHDLISAIWSACPVFAGWRQHDSQELLLAVLSRLDAEEKWLVTQGKTPTNVVSDLFRGKAVTHLRTVTSARLKQNERHFTGSISVQIPAESANAFYIAPSGSTGSRRGRKRGRNNEPCTLEDCLMRAMRETPLDSSTYSSIKQTWEDLPHILFVHLARSVWGPGGNKKCRGYVSFPLKDMVVPGNKHTHSLYGIVVHHGRAVGLGLDRNRLEPTSELKFRTTRQFNQGHYTSICRIRDEWFEFNDHIVKRVNESYVRSVEAYLLVYERDDSGRAILEALREEEEEEEEEEDDDDDDDGD